MKSISSRPVGITIITLLLAGLAPVGWTQTSPFYPIAVKVSPEDHTANGAALPNTTVRIETRTEKLDILIQNTTRSTYSNLVVRYCIFDQDVQSQKIAVALQHEAHVALLPQAALIVTSQVASITHTPSHFVTTKQKSAKKGEPEIVKETPAKATGKLFAGYGVQVLQPDLAGQLAGSPHPTNVVLGVGYSSWDLTNHFKAAFSGAKSKP